MLKHTKKMMRSLGEGKMFQSKDKKCKVNLKEYVLSQTNYV